MNGCVVESKERSPVATSQAQASAILFTGRMLAFLVTFGTPLILVRLFSVEEFGLYKQVLLVHGTLLQILQFALPASLSYFAVWNVEARSSFISQTFWLLILAGVLGGSLLIIFRRQLATWMQSPGLESLIPLLALFIVLSLSSAFLEGLMIALKHTHRAAWTYFCLEMTRTGAMIGAVLLMGGVVAILWAGVLWAFARCVTLFAYVRRLGVALFRRLERRRVLEQWRYAYPFAFGVILLTCADTLHFYLVSLLYDVKVFAVYSAGFIQFPFVEIAFASLADVTLVRLTELRREGRVQDIQEVIAGSVLKLGLVLIPLYMWLLINANDLMRILYTERFAESASVFMVSLTIVPITVLGLDYVPRGFGDTGFIFRINLLRLLLTGSLTSLLGISFGPIWLAVGTVLALIITKGLTIRRVGSLLGVPAGRLLPWGRLFHLAVTAATAGAVAMVLGRTWALSPVMRVAITVLPFICTYSTLAWSCGVLRKEEKTRIRGTLLGLTKLVNPASLTGREV